MRFSQAGGFSGIGHVGGLTGDFQGDYRLKDESLTLNFKNASSKSDDPVLQIVKRRLTGVSQSGRIEWKNDKEFIFTGRNKSPIAFERIKD